MTRDSGELIVVTDGRLMHLKVTHVYHRHYPETRGEGRSLGEASRHLARLLARGLDHAHGVRRVALECALADLRAIRPPDTRPRSPPTAVIS